MASEDNEKRVGRGARKPGLVAGVIVAAFVMAASAIILSGHVAKRPAGDQNRWHLVAIQGFAEDWPAPDISDYKSATTPLYHIVIAAAHVYISDDVRLLRGVGSMFTVGLFTTLGLWVGRRRGWKEALAMCAPLACSLYVLSAGGWLLPDNAAWWGVLGVLLISLRREWSNRLLVGAAVVLTLLVLTRQIHIWAAGVVWMAAWMGPVGLSNGFFRGERLDARLGRVALAVSATLPAFLVVGYFVWLWGGLAPPMFQINNPGTGQLDVQGGNPIIPGTILAIFGGFGFFYSGYLLHAARRVIQKRQGWELWVVVAAGVVGLLVAGIPHSSFDAEAGRWTAIWNVVRGLPTLADRSPAIVIPGAVGGLLAGLWFVALPQRPRWIFAAAFIGFIAAQSASTLAWQRYYEPFLLLLLILMATTVAHSGDENGETARPPAWAPIGPAILAVILLGVTVLSLKS